MTRSIAVAMALAIVIAPLASTESRSRNLRSELTYKWLTWEEKSDICIAAAPVMLEECEEPESVIAVAQTEEQVALEDGTVVVQTSNSFIGMAAPDEIEQKVESSLTEQIAYGVAGAVGWEIGTMIGAAAGKAAAAATAGTSYWAVGAGAAVVAPWLGGAIVAAGAIY